MGVLKAQNDTFKGKNQGYPKFFKITDFREGLAIIIQGYDKFGFIDKDSNLIVALNYDMVHHFHEGLAVVKVKDKYGFVNTKGSEVIVPQYDYAFGFSEGLAKVILKGKVGFIDKEGNVIIPLIYDETFTMKVTNKDLSEFLVSPKSLSETFLDMMFYDEKDKFLKNMAQVHKNGKWFYINKQGECVKDCP
jgi:hypothetical protein